MKCSICGAKITVGNGSIEYYEIGNKIYACVLCQRRTNIPTNKFKNSKKTVFNRQEATNKKYYDRQYWR